MKKSIISFALLAMVCGGFATGANATEAETLSCSMSCSTASSDWDKLLDEYEEYVDLYIKTYKKAQNGDMSAMNEYVKLMQKAQKLSSQLGNAQKEMSSAQLQRYVKITQKMANGIK